MKYFILIHIFTALCIVSCTAPSKMYTMYSDFHMADLILKQNSDSKEFSVSNSLGACSGYFFWSENGDTLKLTVDKGPVYNGVSLPVCSEFNVMFFKRNEMLLDVTPDSLNTDLYNSIWRDIYLGGYPLYRIDVRMSRMANDAENDWLKYHGIVR